MTALVLVFLLVVYAILVVLLMIGWNRTYSTDTNDVLEEAHALSVSVIVPARNEEAQIATLLNDLQAQRYHNFEVIVVDDHSDDNTSRSCRNQVGEDRRFRIVKAIGQGKKQAISQGVRMSGGDIIVTTDADCRVGPDWLFAMTGMFKSPAVQMVFGGVIMSGSSFFDRMQSLEFSTLVGTGAATAGWHRPTMCNAANLAYRKAAFEEVSGYTDNMQVPSGDDEFLMRKINALHPQSIHYCADSRAIVTTLPSINTRTFFAQRIRWAGKWRSNTDPTAKLLAVFVFVFHLSMVALPWLVVLKAVAPVLAVTVVLIKLAVEFFFIRSVYRVLAHTWHWSAFLALQVVHSYYVVTVALCAPFVSFEWKGRRLKPFMARPCPQWRRGGL